MADNDIMQALLQPPKKLPAMGGGVTGGAYSTSDIRSALGPAPPPGPGGNLASAVGGGPVPAPAPAPGQPVQAAGLQAVPPAGAAPAATTAAPAATPAAGPDPFAASGGGVQIAGGQWVPRNHPLAAQATPGAGAAGGAGTGAAPSANPLGDVFRNALVSRLGDTAAPTSVAGDPALAAQSAAFRQSSARDAARQRSAGMESLGASGLESSGAAGSMARKIGADRTQAEGAFDANLLGGARTQRMQELQGLLGIAGNTLSNEDRLRLDTELGRGGQDIQRQGIASQTALGQGDLALRGELGRGGLNQNLLSILLNNRAQNDQLGLQAGGMEMGANTAAMQALLGGAR